MELDGCNDEGPLLLRLGSGRQVCGGLLVLPQLGAQRFSGHRHDGTHGPEAKARVCGAPIDCYGRTLFRGALWKGEITH